MKWQMYGLGALANPKKKGTMRTQGRKKVRAHAHTSRSAKRRKKNPVRMSYERMVSPGKKIRKRSRYVMPLEVDFSSMRKTREKIEKDLKSGKIRKSRVKKSLKKKSRGLLGAMKLAKKERASAVKEATEMLKSGWSARPTRVSKKRKHKKKGKAVAKRKHKRKAAKKHARKARRKAVRKHAQKVARKYKRKVHRKKRAHKKTRKHARKMYARKHRKKAHRKPMRKARRKRKVLSVETVIANPRRKHRKQKKKHSRRKHRRMSNPIGGNMLKGFGRSLRGGFSTPELVGLAAASTLSGVSRRLLSGLPVVGSAVATMDKVPVIGANTLPVVLGAFIDATLGKKSKWFEALGKGLVAVGVIGAGAEVAKMLPIPGTAAVSGLDFGVGAGVPGLDFGMGTYVDRAEADKLGAVVEAPNFGMGTYVDAQEAAALNGF